MNEKVKSLISRTLEIPEESLNDKTNLVKDLELESLDLVDLVAAFEDEFKVEILDKDIKNLQTVEDIVNYIESRND